jgi:dihydroorotase
MLSLVDKEVISIERLVELMAHNPAKLFAVSERGFIREGYKADLVIVRKGEPWTVTRDCILSKCGWSPVEGKQYNWHVAQTILNGKTAYTNGNGNQTSNLIGEPITFRV